MRPDYELLGPSDGPLVMLHHSMACTRHMWDPQVSTLQAAGLRVLWYDLRGHGRSPAPSGPYSLDELGSDAAGLLTDLGLPPAIHVGLSLGGMVSMWLAAHRPQLVRTLVLSSTSAEMLPSSAWTDRAALARRDGCDPIADLMIPRWFTPDFAAAYPDAVRAIDEQIRSTPPEGFAGCCEAVAAMDLRRNLPTITAPTWVLVGEQDPGTSPEHARVIAEHIPGARLTVLNPGAHILNVERADEFSAAILNAIRIESTRQA